MAAASADEVNVDWMEMMWRNAWIAHDLQASAEFNCQAVLDQLKVDKLAVDCNGRSTEINNQICHLKGLV